MYKVGDEIKFYYPSPGDEIINGTIITITTDGTWGNVYQIQCADDASMWSTFLLEDQFNKCIISPLYATKETLCQCGSDKLGHPGHSYFCPLGKK